MLVLVNGLPYFGKKIVRDLNAFDQDNNYVFCDTYHSKWDQLKFLLLLPCCKAVLSFNGVSDNSNSLNWVLRLNKRLVMQWQGTDVQLAVERHRNASLDSRYIDYARHLASAPWFVSELERVVPLIHYAPFGYTEVTGNKARYKKVQLLTYLAKGKEEFYGWNHICRIANTLRENDIVVIGTDGEGLQTPANVHFLGWVSEAEVLSIMKESAIFLRLAQHDGKSLAVSKALSVGCEVIWTFRHPCCHHVEDNEADVVRKTVEVVETVNTGSMTPNPDNIDFAETHLLRSQVINHYVKRLKQVLHD